MTHYRAVLLDVDGTLIDSNDAHAHAWVEALSEHGHQVRFDEVRRLIGMGGDKLLPIVAGLDSSSAEGKQVEERRGEIFKQKYLPTLQPTPGAALLLRQMRDHGLKLVVASSAKGEELKDLLKVAHLEWLVQEETSSSEAENSKPDPDIVHVALKKAGFPPTETVFMGDTPYDIEAAGKARVKTIAVRCGGWKDYDLKGALAIYDNPAHLLTHYAESPLGK